jgi:FkbH-like protein
LTKAQLERARARTGAADEAAFLKTLDVDVQVVRLAAGAPDLARPDLARIEELFQRTTQFNTTGARYSVADLERLLASPEARLFAVRVRDRFGDHGLVGAAVIAGPEILNLAMSCRVLGMGVEHTFMRHVLREAREPLIGRIVETARNRPVRNIFRDHGFRETEPGVWRQTVAAAMATVDSGAGIAA